MFLQLATEILPTLPPTAAQRARYDRALNECSGYSYEVVSDLHAEAACRVTTEKGRYLAFTDACTCPDWTHRSAVLGNGDIELCKHTIAAYITGHLVEPLAQDENNPPPPPVLHIEEPEEDEEGSDEPPARLDVDGDEQWVGAGALRVLRPTPAQFIRDWPQD